MCVRLCALETESNANKSYMQRRQPIRNRTEPKHIFVYGHVSDCIAERMIKQTICFKKKAIANSFFGVQERDSWRPPLIRSIRFGLNVKMYFCSELRLSCVLYQQALSELLRT